MLELSIFDLTRDSTSGIVHLCSLVVTPSLVTRVVQAQSLDPLLASVLEFLVDDTLDHCPSEWSVGSDGGLRFSGRLCVPDDPEIRKEVLSEAHRSRYAIHPGGVKMYHDLKRTFWWPGLKRDVSEFVARYMTCQQVKAEHMKPGGLLQSLPVPEWKWEHISMDFVDGFPRSRKGNEGIWVIVCRLIKVAHFLPVPAKKTSRTLADQYMREFFCLHGIPVTIVSDQDPCFTLGF